MGLIFITDKCYGTYQLMVDFEDEYFDCFLDSIHANNELYKALPCHRFVEYMSKSNKLAILQSIRQFYCDKVNEKVRVFYLNCAKLLIEAENGGLASVYEIMNSIDGFIEEKNTSVQLVFIEHLEVITLLLDQQQDKDKREEHNDQLRILGKFLAKLLELRYKSKIFIVLSVDKKYSQIVKDYLSVYTKILMKFKPFTSEKITKSLSISKEWIWDKFIGFSSLKKEFELKFDINLMSTSQENNFLLKPFKGFLIVGKSGNGKSTFLEDISLNLKRRNIFVEKVSSTNILSQYFGESEKNLRQIFIKARDNFPSAILFDDLDNLFNKQDNTSSFTHRLTTTLLNELDGIEDGKKVIFIATVTRKDDLSKALLRPGRIDAIFEIPKLTKADAESLFWHFMPTGIKFKTKDIFLKKLEIATASVSEIKLQVNRIKDLLFTKLINDETKENYVIDLDQIR